MSKTLLFLLLFASVNYAVAQDKSKRVKTVNSLKADSVRTVVLPPYKGDIALDNTLGRIQTIMFQSPLQASEICDSLLVIYPDDELIKIYKINSVFAVENKSERISKLISFSDYENNPVILSAIINRLQITNDFVYTTKTDDIATKLILLRGDVDDYYLRGEIRVDLERFSSALLDYDRALELSFDHNNPKILQSIAFCYKAAGQYFEAIQSFNKALPTSDQKGNVIYNRGICKLELHDYRGAIADFDLAIISQSTPLTGYPYKPQILLQKARANIALKDYTNAVTYLVTAIKSAGPENDEFKSGAYNLLGIARHYLKQKEMACANWSKAGSLGSREAYDNIKLFCK